MMMGTTLRAFAHPTDFLLMIYFDTTSPAFHAPAGSHFSTIRISHHGLRERTPADDDDDAGEHAVKTGADILRIPAQDEHSFWFNVNTCSG